MFGLPLRVWAYVGCALAIVGSVAFFEHWCEHRGYVRGESDVRGQWQKAIDAQYAATAQAQIHLTKSSEIEQQITTEKVVRVRKIVADFSESAHSVSDEKLYASARDAVFRVRNTSGLTVSDVSPAANPA